MSEQTNISQMEPWFDENEERALSEYMKGGGWLTEFTKTEEFESQIASYLDIAHCAALPNGTVSLFVALKALGIGEGDEVIVPDYTMIATANAVRMACATPVFVDVEKDTLCISLNTIQEAVTPQTRAVIQVSINGRTSPVDEIAAFCKERKIVLVEDAAQSLGSTFQGKALGTFGDVGSFSFSSPKVITTGQGGALVTNDADLHARILKIKDFGRTQSGVDEHETMGYNFKFTDLQAVVGIEQLKKLEWRVKRKKAMYRVYEGLLSEVKGVEMIATNTKETSPWFVDILVDAAKRDDLISYLKEQGIGARQFYPAIHTQAPYEEVRGEFPVAEEVSERGLWLPSSSFLKDEDVERVCTTITKFFNQ